MGKYRDKIFFLTDRNEYIYQEDARFLEDGEYDPHSFRIINPNEQDLKRQYIIKEEIK